MVVDDNQLGRATKFGKEQVEEKHEETEEERRLRREQEREQAEKELASLEVTCDSIDFQMIFLLLILIFLFFRCFLILMLMYLCVAGQGAASGARDPSQRHRDPPTDCPAPERESFFFSFLSLPFRNFLFTHICNIADRTEQLKKEYLELKTTMDLVENAEENMKKLKEFSDKHKERLLKFAEDWEKVHPPPPLSSSPPPSLPPPLLPPSPSPPSTSFIFVIFLGSPADDRGVSHCQGELH